MWVQQFFFKEITSRHKTLGLPPAQGGGGRFLHLLDEQNVEKTKQDSNNFSLSKFFGKFSIAIKKKSHRVCTSVSRWRTKFVRVKNKKLLIFSNKTEKIRRLCGDREKKKKILDAIGGYIIIIYLQAEMRWAVTFAALCGYLFFFFFLKIKKIAYNPPRNGRSPPFLTPPPPKLFSIPK